MEGNGGSGSSVVPTGVGLPSTGGHPTGQGVIPVHSATNFAELDPAEQKFRTDVKQMLNETMGSQRTSSVVRHCEGMEWLGGVAGLRMVVSRSKIKTLPVTL